MEGRNGASDLTAEGLPSWLAGLSLRLPGQRRGSLAPQGQQPAVWPRHFLQKRGIPSPAFALSGQPSTQSNVQSTQGLTVRRL